MFSTSGSCFVCGVRIFSIVLRVLWVSCESNISIFSWNGGVPHLLKFRLLLLVKLVTVTRNYCNANCRRYQLVEGLKEQRQRVWGNCRKFSINSHLEARRCTEGKVVIRKAKKDDHLLKQRKLIVFNPFSLLSITEMVLCDKTFSI